MTSLIRTRNFRQLLAIPVIALATLIAGAADKSTAPASETAKKRPPVELTADQMDYDLKNHKAYFSGNVHVIDQDVEIKGDKMTLIFDDKDELQKLEIDGNVWIKREDQLASSGRADYDLIAGKLVLTDTPVLRQGKSRISGAKRIYYDREKGRLWTEGRSTVTFDAGDENPFEKIGKKKD